MRIGIRAASRSPARFRGTFSAATNFGRRVHGATAILGAAIARGLVITAVIKAVIVGDFFARRNALHGVDPYPALFLPCLAIWVAAVVDEHGGAMAVDDDRAISESKQVGDGRLFIEHVRLILTESRTGVFRYARTLRDTSCGIATGGVNRGGADDKCHANMRCFPWGASGTLWNASYPGGPIGVEMNTRFFAIGIISCALVYGAARPAGPQSPQPPKPVGQQKPSAPAPSTEANPFPDDTNNVPVMPSKGAPPATPDPDAAAVSAPSADSDPVRSPDEPVAEASDSDSSSSNFSGMDKVLPPADADNTGKKDRAQAQPEHQESAKEDESVGNYYLSEHNWKAALSRFESAVVLDPENPEVYWGMAEAQRHLGNLTEAKANYLKLIDYDPDSKHGKEARRLLKDPALENAPTASAKKP